MSGWNNIGLERALSSSRLEITRQRYLNEGSYSDAEICFMKHLENITKYIGDCGLCLTEASENDLCYSSEDFVKVETTRKELSSTPGIVTLRFLCESCILNILTSAEPRLTIKNIKNVGKERKRVLGTIIPSKVEEIGYGSSSSDA
ncbi:TPA_asm: protein 4 [Primula virus 1]|uniref:Protein 4 n=1 Tax=Primula virus 1 TaxID=2977982 RepID=A0A9N6YIX7_9RHAB|nr:TPA_asm: protein 4 [Primula virus 1]